MVRPLTRTTAACGRRVTKKTLRPKMFYAFLTKASLPVETAYCRPGDITQYANDMFDLVDDDNDTRISHAEWARFCKMREVPFGAETFKIVDTDRDNFVSRHEFRTYFQNRFRAFLQYLSKKLQRKPQSRPAPVLEHSLVPVRCRCRG